MALKNHLELKELENIYCSRDNYKIVDRETPKGVYAKKCYVFFSSHSIYYPNSDEIFEEVIVRNDKFEWVNCVPFDCSRAIFLRDLKKQRRMFFRLRKSMMQKMVLRHGHVKIVLKCFDININKPFFRLAIILYTIIS